MRSAIHDSARIVVSGPWPGHTRVSGEISRYSLRRLAAIFAGLPPWMSVRPDVPARTVSPENRMPSDAAWNAAEPSVCPGVWSTTSTVSPSRISLPSLRRRSGFTGGVGASRYGLASRAFFSSRFASTSWIPTFAPVASFRAASSAVWSAWPWVLRMNRTVAPASFRVARIFCAP